MYLQLSIFVVAIALTFAEPPIYNTRQFEPLETAPYQYSGWRPAGPQFRLPEPHQIYGPPQGQYQVQRTPSQEYLPPSRNFVPPQNTYGPPPQEYGPPPEEATTTVEPEVTTTELPTTTESNDLEAAELGSGESGNESEKLTNGDQGVYYIYHPTGLLQRVVYATKDDVEKMAFSAKLKYENVEPIRGPIFTYDPETHVFRRL